MLTELPIVIIGAGFAGLLLAQGLHRRGIPFEVYEQDALSTRPYGHRFRLDGAGIEALLDTIPAELGELFEKTCPKVVSRKPTVRDLRMLKELPIPPRPDSGVRACVPIDRTWILSLLSLGIEDKIHRDKKFVSYELLDSSVRVRFSDGTFTTGRLLIGADGIHSAVRRQLQPDRKLLDTERQIIWGRTWISPGLERASGPEVMTWLVGLDQQYPKNNLILEPILWRSSLAKESDGRLLDAENYIYWAFSTPVPSSPPRTPEQLQAYITSRTQHWNPHLLAIFNHADWNLAVSTRIYSSKPDIGDFFNGKGLVTLIGDSAHPMTPQGGLGGSIAAQDAADLCRTIEKGESLAGFEERMRVRAKSAIETSFGMAKIMINGKDWLEFVEDNR